jgi:colanic acid biosynthesis glycosyl transferase WcaI
LLADADLCFITQQAGSGNSFFPSKLLGLLAFSKPVVTVAAAETELAQSLDQGGFGINITPGQPAELAKILDDLAADPQRLNRFGSAGRQYVQQFEKQRVLNDFARELEALVAPRS